MRAYMMFQMASFVAIRWPPNGQWTKCVPNAFNPCPHSHLKKLDAEGWTKPRWIHNIKVKVECAMWNEQIDSPAINHSLAPLPKQKQMWALDAEEMESTSKIDPRDLSWWKSIKDVCRPGVLVTTRLSKEGCISLAVRGGPSCVARKHDWSKCRTPLTWETYSSKMGLSKIWNLEHKYGAIKAQFLRKINGVHFSIKKRPIPPKDINSQAWCLAKGPWEDSHDLKPIMSPHTCVIFLLKLAKRKEGRRRYCPCEMKMLMSYTWG
jgi:hypothetical protein